MAEVVSRLQPLLKNAGFRKRRHSFNRGAEPGLVHVVRFQMGPFEPPGPGSRQNQAIREELGMAGSLYGKFTVNLGVYVPEMRTDFPAGRAWCREYHCEVRQRLGRLVPPDHADVWWSLDDVDAATADVEHCLREYGLPWLDALPTRAAVVERYQRDGRAWLGMAPSAPIEIGSLLLALGRKDEAMTEFRAHCADRSHPAHHRYFEKWLEERGISLDQ